MNKKILSFGTVLMVLFLIFVYIPSGTAFTPTTGLDPAEVTVGNSNSTWYFKYGSSASYGVYVRDVRWCTAGVSQERYVGMANIPQVYMNGSNYSLPRGVCTKGHLAISYPDHYIVWFEQTFMAGGHKQVLNITFELWDSPPSAPNPNNAWIQITVNDYAQYDDPTIIAYFRVDLDICGLTTPGDDKVYGYDTSWDLQDIEITWDNVLPHDSTYNMEILQVDTNLSGTPDNEEPGSGPWAGIVPYLEYDVFHLVRFNNTEYNGYPTNYVSDEDIESEDIVIWYKNYPINASDLRQPINIGIWMY